MCLEKMSSLVLAFLTFSFLNCLFPVALAQTTPRPPPPAVPSTPTVEYYFTVGNATFPNLCGKTVLTVNGSYPGPEIRVQRGQKLRVHVFNNGSYGITIHWHGVKQPRNPWFDGPEYVTQCPIHRQQSFTYEVILSDEIGTIWWHAHSDWTRGTVHGAFVILPSPDELQESPYAPYLLPDHTLIFATWHGEDLKYISDNIDDQEPGSPIGFTINGYPGDIRPSTDEDECLVTETYNISVVPGQTYLLRIVNAALEESQYFGIRDHTLTVVAQDGALVKQFSTDYIVLFAGQTMDVTFKADQTASQYYMVFQNFQDATVNTTGLIKYPHKTPADIQLPEFPNGDNATNESVEFTRQLKNINDSAEFPRNIDVKRFNLTQSGLVSNVNGTLYSSTMNNVSFVLPKDKSILQAYSEGDPNYDIEFTEYTWSNPAIRTTKVIELNYGDAVEIVYLSNRPHPLHLHGYNFFLVGVGMGNEAHLTDYNLENPPEMNTASVFANGWTAVRFFAKNPGVWFMHCHFEQHATRGMATVLIVRDGVAGGEEMIKLEDPSIMPSCDDH